MTDTKKEQNGHRPWWIKYAEQAPATVLLAIVLWWLSGQLGEVMREDVERGRRMEANQHSIMRKLEIPIYKQPPPNQTGAEEWPEPKTKPTKPATSTTTMRSTP